MAADEYWVDPNLGDDAGIGSLLDPWKTVQYALTNAGLGTDGTILYVKAGTADVITASLDYSAMTPTAAAPLVIAGYGGVGEISAGGSAYGIFNGTKNYVHFYGMKVGNTGTAQVIKQGSYCSIENCEIHTSSASYPLQIGAYSSASNCHIHSVTGQYAVYMSSTASMLLSCFVTGSMTSAGVRTQGLASIVCGNLVVVNGVGVHGAAHYTSNVLYDGNTFYNKATGTLTNAGIATLSTATNGNIFRNNIFAGFGLPIDVYAGTGLQRQVTGNAYWNNDTDIPDLSDGAVINSGNVILSSDPFYNAANDDFRVDEQCRAMGWPSELKGSNTPQYIDIGAAQRIEGGVALARAIMG